MIQFIKLEKVMSNESLWTIDIATLNGENGDYLKKTDMNKYCRYESTARTVLRLMWFLDFVFNLFDGLIKN